MTRDIAPPSESPRTRVSHVRESASSLRSKFAAFCSPDRYGKHGPQLFATKLCEQLGLIDERGQPYLNPVTGTIGLNPKRALESSSISGEDLMWATLGPEARNYLDPQQGGSFLGSSLLREGDAAPAIGPSALSNITAFKTGITGLYMARMLEEYESAEFNLSRMAGVDTMAPGTPQNQRLISVVGSGIPAPQFDPAQGHPAFRMDDMFVLTDKPLVKGGKIFISKMTALHDITGGKILAEAAQAGRSIALAEELDFIEVLTGIKNNFTMGFTNDLTATAYPTYNSTAIDYASYFYVNTHVNQPVDYRNLGLARDLMFKSRHPIKKTPIMVNATTAIVPYPNMEAALKECNAPKVQRRYDDSSRVKQPGLTVAEVSNPYAGLVTEIICSAWLQYKLLLSTSVDPDFGAGLGLTDGTTAQRWYYGDFARAIKKRVGWNINAINLAPNTNMAADHLLDFGLYFDAYYHFQVVSPWHLLENKQA